jgi:hypothetical protein
VILANAVRKEKEIKGRSKFERKKSNDLYL